MNAAVWGDKARHSSGSFPGDPGILFPRFKESSSLNLEELCDVVERALEWAPGVWCGFGNDDDTSLHPPHTGRGPGAV